MIDFFCIKVYRPGLVEKCHDPWTVSHTEPWSSNTTSKEQIKKQEYQKSEKVSLEIGQSIY